MPKAGTPTPKRRYVLFTRWRRRRFFALLEETGSVRAACALSGAGRGCIYRLRRVEPGFSERMAAAKDLASLRLREKEAAPQDERMGLVVRRGVGGRLRLMDPGPHHWEARHDEIFLVHLRATGNIAASARAARFTAKVPNDRRRRLPAFDAACEAALAESEILLGDVLLEEAAKWPAATYDAAFAAEPPEELDVDRAIAILTYWNRKAKGRGPRR